jgi:predicted nucleotidyltransferase
VDRITVFEQKHALRLASLLKDAAFPTVLCVWLYGSMARKDELSDSDVDLAILCERNLTNIERFDAAQILSLAFKREVDIVDIRTVTPDLGARIVALDGIRFDLCAKLSIADEWEVIQMSRYCQLNFERRGILEDILKRKKVYGG